MRLAARYPAAIVADMLRSGGPFRPHPTIAERCAWNALPASLRAIWLRQGEALRHHAWDPLPATLFLDFRRTGNRSRYQNAHFARRTDLARLVIAECMADEGEFLDDIVNGVWAICEESFWGIPAHVATPLPDVLHPTIDLFAAETAALLAWTVYLLGERLDAGYGGVADRVLEEVRRKIVDPYLTRADFGWMGFTGETPSNWNPWCNSNCLAVLLLLPWDEETRIAGVTKALQSLDFFVAAYPDDGGCDEGALYWGQAAASLFECLELLYGATGGQMDVYDDPKLAEMGRYLYRAWIGGDAYINFADCPAKVKIPAELVYRFGQRIGDEGLAQLGAYAYQRYHGDTMDQFENRVALLRQLPALFHHEELMAESAIPPLLRDVWLPGLQVFAARERAGSTDGFFVAAKAGHNAESHNHNDVGQYMVYYDGEPVIIDVGVEAYTAKTFSGNRYDIWTMQSAYHNLPTIGGHQQAPDRHHAARDVRCTGGASGSTVDSEGCVRAGSDVAELVMDLAHAYPQAAGIVRWLRTVRLLRHAGLVEVVDAFELCEARSDVRLSVMTAQEPVLEGPGRVRLGVGADTSRSALLTFDAAALQPTVEVIAIQDARLASAWGDAVYRLILDCVQPVRQARWVMQVRRG